MLYKKSYINLLMQQKAQSEIQEFKFTPPAPFYDFQKECIENFKKHMFSYIVLPRRAGKEYMTWCYLLECAFNKRGTYGFAYPTLKRGKKILWGANTILDDGTNMGFLDFIPKVFITKRNDQECIIQLTNGSIIRLYTSNNLDDTTGMSFDGLVISEYQESDPRFQEKAIPIIIKAKGWIIFQTTICAKNFAYKFYQEVKNDDAWFTQYKTIEDIYPPEQVDSILSDLKNSHLSESAIRSEYYNDPSGSDDRLYFSLEIPHLKITDDRLVKIGQPINFAFDIGVNDPTFIIAFQDMNILWCHESSGVKHSVYADKIKEYCNINGCNIGKVYLPHDGNNRDKVTATSPAMAWRQMGFSVTVVERPKNMQDKIQSTRKYLTSFTFYKQDTERLIECIENYQKKYDPHNNIYSYDEVRDWTNHGVDALQTLCIGMDKRIVNTKKVAIGSYLN